MNKTTTKPEEMLFETIASCTMVIAALAITALLYQLITVAVPLLESMVFPQVLAQGAPKTLAAVFAHADDEGAAAPILARYAREGVQVYLVIATDGAQGGAHTSIPRGPELARVRSEEARCATDALGIHPPILLGFPDAQLGNYMEDRTRLFQLTARVQGELHWLRPDAVITWGPDGATGHPDHRLVSSVVTQLVRAGAPGAPERLFYASLPVEGFRVMNPARGEPPFLNSTGEVFQRPRFVLHSGLRSVAAFDGVPQNAVLGRHRATSVRGDENRIEGGTAACSVASHDGCHD